MKTHKIIVCFFLLFSFSSLGQISQANSSDLVAILKSYFSKTNSSSVFLKKDKSETSQASRSFLIKNDSLFIYTYDPLDAITNAPLYDTTVIYLPMISKLKLEKGKGSFGEKGLGLTFVPKVFLPVDSKKMGNKSYSAVELKDNNMSQIQGANVTQKLSGQAAGVYVGGSAAPGSTAMVRIRGIGSINANSPLYIVDDVPISQQNINSINPEDIEKVEVLKDASATALYGVRGANGVIVITTKKGNPSSSAEKELASLPETPITLWIWGKEVDAFQKDKVEKTIKTIAEQLANR